MDLKEILDDKPKKQSNKQGVYKKSMQLKDIERRSKTNTTLKVTKGNIDSVMNDEINTLYNKKWNKLDVGCKINRLKKFSLMKQKELNLDTNQLNQLNILLKTNCQKSNLNRNSDINYDIEKMEIIDIKILNFNDDTKTFSLNISHKKKETVKKSKSNLDKFFN